MASRIPTPVNVETLKHLYYEKGMTQQEVADVMGLTRKIIYNTMRRNGLKGRIPKKRNQSLENNDFWRGGRTINTEGYILVRCDGHPRATKQGSYVMEHILTMEKYLGRNLKYFGKCDKRNEVVHHKNLVKDDNRIENLQLMTHSEHVKLHNKLRKEEKTNE